MLVFSIDMKENYLTHDNEGSAIILNVIFSKHLYIKLL